MRKARLTTIVLAGLGLMVGFQNCGGSAAGGGLQSVRSQLSMEKPLLGRYKVESYVATSSCADRPVGADEVCSMRYTEDKASGTQFLEFLPNGDVIVEQTCYGGSALDFDYILSGGKGNLNGDPESMEEADLREPLLDCRHHFPYVAKIMEDSLLIRRLIYAVRVVREGPEEITIYTDQSSGIRLKAL